MRQISVLLIHMSVVGSKKEDTNRNSQFKQICYSSDATMMILRDE